MAGSVAGRVVSNGLTGALYLIELRGNQSKSACVAGTFSASIKTYYSPLIINYKSPRINFTAAANFSVASCSKTYLSAAGAHKIFPGC